MIPANIDSKTRRAVYRRDWWACALCDDRRHLQIHHCIPRSLGGNNSDHNLITLCSKCHALAHGTKLDETDRTPQDVRQACIEYLADCYAPEWRPYKDNILARRL